MVLFVYMVSMCGLHLLDSQIVVVGSAKGKKQERRKVMTEKLKVGCARPTGGLVGQDETAQKKEEIQPAKEVRKMINVGKAAPDFTAPAYHKGDFTSVRLSDFAGKWVVLCLYPGDFTFV